MDIYRLFKNGQLIYNGNTFPVQDVNQHVPEAPAGYNPDDYAPADRLDAWLKAGSPQQDVFGRHMTTRGEVYVPDPADAVLDHGGSPNPGGAPANDNLVGGTVWVTLPAPNIEYTAAFDAPAGRYWLQAGEQSDQNWVLSQGAEVKGTGNGSSDEAAPYELDGPGTLVCSFNAAAVSAEVLAARVAAGQGVSKMHYTLRLVK